MNIHRTIVIDCGKNNAAYYDPRTENSKIISHEDLLNLHSILGLSKGDTIVGEYSHIGCPRGDFSLSQPFKADILLNWYKKLAYADVSLKMFPQKSTPRACSNSGLEKNDLNDCKSIWQLLRDNPEISLMNPPRSFDESSFIKEMWEWKDLTNKILNIARWDTYDLQEKGTDLNTLWILDHLYEIYNGLSEEARDCFDFVFYKKKGKENELKIRTQNSWSFAMAQIYSILASMQYHCPIENKIKIRTRETTGNFLKNYHFKRYIVCMSPFHLKGGVARSNLYYHGMRNWIASKAKNADLNFKRKVESKDSKDKVTIRRGHFTPEEDAFFVKYRAIYSHSIIEMYSLLKDILQVEHNLPRHKLINEKTKYSACYS